MVHDERMNTYKSMIIGRNSNSEYINKFHILLISLCPFVSCFLNAPGSFHEEPGGMASVLVVLTGGKKFHGQSEK